MRKRFLAIPRRLRVWKGLAAVFARRAGRLGGFDWIVGCWRVRLRDGIITDGKSTRRLEPRVMEVLQYLARNAGRVVSKDELVTQVWGDVAVTDGAVVRAIVVLRKSLGDDSGKPRYIRTLAKRGYQIIARVECILPQARSRSPARAALVFALPVVLAVLTGLWLRTPVDAAHSLTVEAFRELDALAEREQWSQALSEELAARFSSYSDLPVAFLRGRKEARPTGRSDSREAGLTLSGAVRREDSRARVSCRLTDERTSRLVCAGSCDVPTLSRLDAQRQVAEEIAEAVRKRLR